MAQIKRIRILCLIALSLLPLNCILAQESERQGKKKIEILHTDLMTNLDEMRRLLGNVRLKHKETFMTCDSAHFYPDKNLVEAYSRVHIFKGDSLHLYGDYLLYDSETEYAYVRDSVILIDNETTLYTDQIDYDMIVETAVYNTGGRIINEDNILTSIIGIYHTETEIFNFKDSVKLVNPDYTMYSDTLEYNTENEIAYFLGPSQVIGDSLYARCKRGWYDTRNEKSLLLDDAYIDNEVQIVTGDSLYYESENGFGTAHYDVTIRDKQEDIIVKGNKSEYFKEPERFMITDSAQFIQVNGDDYLYVHADTLRSISLRDTIIIRDTIRIDTMIIVGETVMSNDTILSNDQSGARDTTTSVNTIANDTIRFIENIIERDSAYTYRLVKAFYGCRIYSEDLQAKCDSLSYSFKDSVIRLYHNPVLWSDANQLFADSMALITKNQQMEKMELYNNSFVIEEVDSSRYNQLKGKDLFGYFEDNKLIKIEIRGNSEKIYFAIEDNELVGVDQSTCVDMDIYIEDGKIKEIYMLKNPEGTLDPPLYKMPSLRKLQDFAWFERIRPKSRFDIFRKE